MREGLSGQIDRPRVLEAPGTWIVDDVATKSRVGGRDPSDVQVIHAGQNTQLHSQWAVSNVIAVTATPRKFMDAKMFRMLLISLVPIYVVPGLFVSPWLFVIGLVALIVLIAGRVAAVNQAPGTQDFLESGPTRTKKV